MHNISVNVKFPASLISHEHQETQKHGYGTLDSHIHSHPHDDIDGDSWQNDNFKKERLSKDASCLMSNTHYDE